MVIRATRFQPEIIMSHKLQKLKIAHGEPMRLAFNTFLDYHKTDQSTGIGTICTAYKIHNLDKKAGKVGK